MNFVSNMRLALRSVSREPGHAVAFILTLGLGIGANSAIFSVVNGVLLRPLPYPDADRIVHLQQSAADRGFDNINFSLTEIADYRAQSTTLDEIVEFGDWSFNVLGRGNPHRAAGGLVTANFFAVLGMKPQLGRLLLPEDQRPGAPPMAVLTHEYWARVTGADPGVIGEALDLTVKSATIVGVLEPGAHYASQRVQDFYVNYAANDHYVGASMQEDRSHRMTDAFGRLAAGTSVDAARSELAAIARRLASEYPDDYPESWRLRVALTPWQEALTRRARPTLLILLGTAVCVLLIACANVGNLTLTRLNRREHELATRAALGASRTQLRLLLLSESLVLALGGAAVGLLIAFTGLDMLVGYVGRFTSRTGEISVDATVLGFTLLVAVGAALLLANAPRLAIEGRMANALSSGGGRGTANSRRRRVQGALVVAQVAVSFVLLVGAGLLLRTLLNLYAVDPGFDLDNVLSMETPKFTPISPQEARQYTASIIEQVGAQPGVTSVAMAQRAPLGGEGVFPMFVRSQGAEDVAPGGNPNPTRLETITPEFFATVGTTVLRGRTFTAQDNEDTAPVVIVNESTARDYFGDADPVGRQIQYSFGGAWEEWTTVVGVVADTRAAAIDESGGQTLYLPELQSFAPDTVLVRTAGDPTRVTARVVETIRGIDPERPVERIQTLAELRSENVAPQRLNATLFATFGALALAIAAVGISGVLAYSVSQRTREFGIRVALGAAPGQVVRLVLREGGLLTIAGLLLGAAGAAMLSGSLAPLLFDVAPLDAATFLGTAMILLGVALVAAWLPARRATLADPMETLRGE